MDSTPPVSDTPVNPPRKRKWPFVLLFILVVLILAANFSSLGYLNLEKVCQTVEKMVPDESKFGRDYLSLLLSGKEAQAVSLLGPDLRGYAGQVKDVVKDLKPLGTPVAIHLLNFTIHKNLGTGTGLKELTYFVDFKKVSIVVLIGLDGVVPKGYVVDEFNYNQVPTSFAMSGGFDFFGKTWAHYLFLLISLGVLVFSLVTLVKCARSDVKRKWLWIVFIMVGLFKIGITWPGGSTTEATFQWDFLYIQLFSASLVKIPIYDPWCLSFSIPLGAILFYYLAKPKVEKPAA